MAAELSKRLYSCSDIQVRVLTGSEQNGGINRKMQVAVPDTNFLFSLSLSLCAHIGFFK